MGLLANNDELYLWGEHLDPNKESEAKEALIPIPVQVPFTLKLKNVSCGFEHTLLLTLTGDLYGFGKN